MVELISNVERGSLFEKEVATALAGFGWQLRANVGIGIGNPPKRHRFDLADPSARVAVECKAFTWTTSGNMPSAKITTAREAVLFLQWLPPDWTKILAMSRSLRTGYGESLGEYFVRLNDHLLGDVKVIEVAASQPRFLYGQST
jgi:hypothetical protein